MNEILFAHPGTQVAFRTVTALKEAGMLNKFVTTVYDKDNSFLMRITKLFISGDNLERAKRRKVKALDDNDVIQFCEWMGLISLILVRIDKSQKIYNIWAKWTYDRYQRKTVEYIKKNRSKIKAVIGYDTSSFILFDELAKQCPEIIRITDNAHSSRYYLHDIYNAIDSGKFYKTFENEGGGYLKSKKVANFYKEELLKAQYHFVASTFSKNAAVYTGVSPDKIYTFPYGVDPKFSKSLNKNYNGALNVLFVGEVNQRKGIYQILLAAKQINRSDINFNIVGRGSQVCASFYDEYKPYVNILGHVSFEELLNLYATSHIFVFPTMGEGFGLVILEALSAGLPVICSNNCVGEDIIKNEMNGFVIDAGNEKQLIEKILWFDAHRTELEKMSENSTLSVKELTWSNYNKNLINIINEIIEKHDYKK